MSPGTPGGEEGPRRINWDRLPGPEGPGSPPPSGPRRPSTPPGGLPRGPVAGGDATHHLPRIDNSTGPRDRVTAERDRVNTGFPGGGSDRATGSHSGPRPPSKDADKKAESRLSQPHKRQYLSLWIELPLLLVVAFSAAVLLRTFAVQPFYIPSGSMEQTLQEGDKVLVLKLTQTLRSPQRGEVVVFRGTDSWDPEYRPRGGDGSVLSDVGTAVLDLIGLAEPNEKDFIKRVIAVGGDTVSCCDADGNVVVNGVSMHEEEYVYDNASLDIEPGTCGARRFEAVTVPEGEVWVMGDHRGDSKDSRCQGPVPVENIIGRAIALVWPTDRARDLEIPTAFAALEGTTGDSGEGDEDTEQAAFGGLTDPGRATWDGAWHPPPSLPATALPNHGSQASPRWAPLRSQRDRVDSHRDRRRASARRRR